MKLQNYLATHLKKLVTHKCVTTPHLRTTVLSSLCSVLFYNIYILNVLNNYCPLNLQNNGSGYLFQTNKFHFFCSIFAFLLVLFLVKLLFFYMRHLFTQKGSHKRKRKSKDLVIAYFQTSNEKQSTVKKSTQKFLFSLLCTGIFDGAGSKVILTVPPEMCKSKGIRKIFSQVCIAAMPSATRPSEII